MGVHPTHGVWEGKTYDHPWQHSIAIMCDDIDATVDQLRGKGAQFRKEIEEREDGRIIMIEKSHKRNVEMPRGRTSISLG